MLKNQSTGVIAIGRNEGERLRRCLASLAHLEARIYVDSGSEDGSAEWARLRGADVVELSTPPKFTAARARNAGLARLIETSPDLDYVQMIDGDCELSPDWIEAGVRALEADPGLGAVFGRLRERFPDRSIYNRLCDDEWDVPLGDAYFGGIVLLRLDAARQVPGGYNADIIAAEDTEFCERMRAHGWRAARISAEMALHDAEILRFGQWWRRTKRAGHGFAELQHRHPDRLRWRAACRRIVTWGLVVPLLTLATLVLALTVSPWFLGATMALLGLWPLQVLRTSLAKRGSGHAPRAALAIGMLLTLGKIPELLGFLTFHRNRLSARESRIIEYKRPGPQN